MCNQAYIFVYSLILSYKINDISGAFTNIKINLIYLIFCKSIKNAILILYITATTQHFVKM